MYKAVLSPSSRLNNPEGSPSHAMYSLKTDDILGASPKAHAYQKTDIVNQYQSKLGANSPASIRTNPNAINYWPYPVKDQGNYQSSAATLPTNNSFSSAVQNSTRIAVYDSANDNSSFRQATQGSYDTHLSKPVDKSSNAPLVLPNMTKMRNPMYADFDYSIYKSHASANNTPAKRKAYVEDSLDALKYSIQTKNQGEVDSGMDQVRSKKTSLKMNDLSSPSSAKNLHKKGVTFEDNSIIKDDPFKVRFSKRDGDHSAYNNMNQNSGRAHSETPRKFFKSEEEINSNRLRQKPSDFYTLNPLTQAPMLRYQTKLNH